MYYYDIVCIIMIHLLSKFTYCNFDTNVMIKVFDSAGSLSLDSSIHDIVQLFLNRRNLS